MKVAWPTLAAISVAGVLMFCLWRFLPNHRDAGYIAGGLGMLVLAQFTKLLNHTGKTIPPPPPGPNDAK
jgi:hypothetical protein